jgi:deazaflavin-dependent oxidoreductase (nitroreductase family)
MEDQQLIETLRESQELDLTVVGRRSGRESTRPVWFVLADGKVQLVPIHGSDSGWYKNVVATPTVRLAAGGHEVEATASPVTDSGRVAEIDDAFRAKYGDREFEEYYPKKDAAVEVELG